MYSPFEIALNEPDKLILNLRKSHKIIRFSLFRVLPWVMMFCLAVAYKGLVKDMPVWFSNLLVLGIGAFSIFLLFYSYETQIIFQRNQFTRKLNVFYIFKDQTELFNQHDQIKIEKEQGGRSESWVFYRIRQQQKKLLFRIPMFLGQNIESRNNLAEAFERICGISVILPDHH